MPVVVVEFAEDAVVEQSNAISSEGAITLPVESADKFYNTNGEGYYDPPVLRKLRWNFAVARGGTYQVEMTYRPGSFSRRADITVGSQILRVSLHGKERQPVLSGTILLDCGFTRNTDSRTRRASRTRRGLGI